ncbi:MAG TPA: homocysteine S-methyltransferase family protein [Hyphomicrobiaceae bacterium]|nr:homocysteine S-methyltransferase family protein [Hyphomicrobiaceae bacterium]
MQKPKYRHALPQLAGGLFLTDGGLETTLIFHEGWDLPHGEAFVLLKDARGKAALRAYFDRYVPMAVEAGAGFVLESPTWRANPDWAAKVGVDRETLAALNTEAIVLLMEIRSAYEAPATPLVVSGCVGPRGDGYDPGHLMSVAAAQDYHAWQIGVFREAGADFVSAITMTNVNEATGFARAAAAADMPSVVSFTLETDGRLPTGQALSEAIAEVDGAVSRPPAYYMINCAHPTHFDHALEPGAAWTMRLRGLRANSSKRSHQELDNAPELDVGNPVELGTQYRDLVQRFPQINVLGGCCGTDHRHVNCIASACRMAA